MKRIKTYELYPGMLTASPVFSKHGQLIIPTHTILSTQHIARMAYYEIEDALIFTEQELTAELLNETEDKESFDTFSKRLKNSSEYVAFQKSYVDKISFVQNSFNDFITRNDEISQKELIQQVNQLFQDHASNLSIFDMLHSIREIDDSTYAHCVNVAIICRMLGQWLDFSQEDLDILTLCGIFHDIGKCMIDVNVLQKPDKLTKEEYLEIKRHPLLGCEILREYDFSSHIKCSVLMHHERNDGSGYPLGVTSELIDPFAQIVSIADVYDAMTANRCYRNGLCPFEVIATFEREGLNKYNTRFILTFLEHIAHCYHNNEVRLNDGRMGTVVFINKLRLSRPIVRLNDGTFINLMEHHDLFINQII